MLTMNQRSLALTITRYGAIAAALLMVTVLTMGRSRAAFTAQASNDDNFFAAGTVVLTDNDADQAMFDLENMAPGDKVERCIVVTYEGTLFPAPVVLYGNVAGDLAPHLALTVRAGTMTGDPAPGSCDGFSVPTPAGPPLYGNTLAGFGSAHSDWASGAAVWTAGSGDTGRALRFTVELPADADDAAQGESATADFVFETRVG
jgi:hypothetical protein